MKIIYKGKVWLTLAMLMAMMGWTLMGCSASKESKDKVRDLDFTVAGNMDIPEELKKLIAEKQQQPFKLTYSDDQNLFIAVGYGVQPTGGYSISVNDLYLTENSVVINTELKGPEKGENAGKEQSFPYIVIKTEYLENPVVFQ
ncbi:MAG: protease complex subunit PrcB family protein [Clostridiaceae bacterium]|uniref:Protease complex subunit PrcB family protein n=1 Tax=Clostridium porci TaxID=2605778 RepID=A0A7X2TCF0_9CLOT|nr:protease complex subunit PrcB family protein [Clostridium porci]MDY3232796.1 protease complex subunit PrcB family protein [Clostridiaceae bacterium]MSS36879.1 protease complex subunit PrcB family protein [Clostridium porci]